MYPKPQFASDGTTLTLWLLDLPHALVPQWYLGDERDPGPQSPAVPIGTLRFDASDARWHFTPAAPAEGDAGR